jgi:hypothetical protein
LSHNSTHRAAAEADAHSTDTLGPRGVWPANPSFLPYFLTEDQLAHLRGKSVRTLQRERRLGCSIPFIRDGKKVLYARPDVLAHYGVAGAA